MPGLVRPRLLVLGVEYCAERVGHREAELLVRLRHRRTRLLDELAIVDDRARHLRVRVEHIVRVAVGVERLVREHRE